MPVDTPKIPYTFEFGKDKDKKNIKKVVLLFNLVTTTMKIKIKIKIEVI